MGLRDRTDVYARLQATLETYSAEDPVLEARLLWEHVTGERYLTAWKPLDPSQERHLEEHTRAIEARVPVQRQIGYTEIRGRRFCIDDHVLLPGPEMEVLLEACLHYTPHPHKLADIGTGSGAIAVSLALECTDTSVYATDISDPALRVARANAEANGAYRIAFLQGDLFAPLEEHGINSCDLIVSNPPYCRTADIPALPAQVRNHSPRIAIDGGEDGLHFHRRIAERAPALLAPGGVLILENEAGQSDAVAVLLQQKGFEVLGRRRNSRGEQRVIIGRWNA